MAVVKIEVQLDWLEEMVQEGSSISEALRDEILSSIQSKMTNRAELAIKEAIDKKVAEVADKITDDFLIGVMKEKINNLQIPYKSDDWRSEVEMLSLSEFVGRRYEQFLRRKSLTENGEVPRYERDAKVSVHEYFTNRFLQKELVSKVGKLIQTARQDAEEQVIKTLESNLKAQLSADIINRLNIPQMLKSLQEKAAMLESGEINETL